MNKETFEGCFWSPRTLQKLREMEEIIVKDFENNCIKNKSVYNGLTHYWYKHLGVL